MKRIFLSIIVSVIFIPLALIGQAIGIFIGPIAASVFEAWFAAAFVVELIPYAMGGYLGGYISALAVSKIYKSFHLIAAMIIPSITIALSLSGNILLPFFSGFQNFDIYATISNALLIIVYFYVLKNPVE